MLPDQHDPTTWQKISDNMIRQHVTGSAWSDIIMLSDQHDPVTNHRIMHRIHSMIRYSVVGSCFLKIDYLYEYVIRKIETSSLDHFFPNTWSIDPTSQIRNPWTLILKLRDQTHYHWKYVSDCFTSSVYLEFRHLK